MFFEIQQSYNSISLLNQHNAQVPEGETQLKEIMGIGPVLADLLAFVNTRQRHDATDTSQITTTDKTECEDYCSQQG
jgi:predicted flap endonuclease-1-like 5' DNA nuclease